MVSARFEQLAEQHLTIHIRGTTEFMCTCPFCGGEKSLQFNIDKGLWNCFKCEEKGNAKGLVNKLGGIYADPLISVEYLRSALDRIKPDYSEEDDEKVLPDSHLNRFLVDASESEYWIGRGFKRETIERWQLGYDPLMDRAIIPYRNLDGGLLGVIQRRMGNVFPRYLYPEGFDRKRSLFGSWKVMEGGESELVITEGSLDAIKVDQAGYDTVAQYGSSIHPFQVELLRRMGIRKVTMFYDYDEAGIKATYKTQHMLDDFIVHNVVWDEEQYCWHKNLCGCGEHIWQEINKCKHKNPCRCGRKHEMDPGELTTMKIRKMLREAVFVGGRKDDARVRTQSLPRTTSIRTYRG